MINATPKNIVSAPKNREERIEELFKVSSFYDNLLEKTSLFLRQMKRSGIGIYDIPENEISDLSNEDITAILLIINPLYSEAERNRKGSNIQSIDNPIFYISGVVNRGEFIERTFRIGAQFSLAVDEISYVLKRKNFYLTLEKDVFFYKNAPLKIPTQTILYKILRCVYDYFKGREGEIQFIQLHKELRKIKGFSRKSNNELNIYIRQYLTSKTLGIGKKMKLRSSEKNNLFKTDRADRLIFTNEKVSD